VNEQYSDAQSDPDRQDVIRPSSDRVYSNPLTALKYYWLR